MLLVDVACPYLTYRFLREYAPGIPIVFALVLSGVFPALGNIVSLVRNRTLDIIVLTARSRRFSSLARSSETARRSR